MALLISSIIVGFVVEFPAETVLGAVTLTSSVTSTSYYYRSVATAFSTQFATSTASAHATLGQDRMDGPYLKISAKFGYIYYIEGGKIDGIFIDSTVTNLLNVGAEKVIFYLRVLSLDGAVMEDVDCIVGAIREGQTTIVKSSVAVAKTFYSNQVKVTFLRVAFNLAEALATVIPAATYTYYGTQTDTYVRTYVTEVTLQEPAYVEFVRTPMPWLLVTGGVVVLAAFFFLRKKKKPIAAPTAPLPSGQASSQRVCSSCGNKMESDAEFCMNCGKKKE